MIFKSESYEKYLGWQEYWNSKVSKKFEKLGPQPISVRVPHSWHEAYASAFTESDPSKLNGRIEYALNAIERRYSEWGSDPGTPAELTAIQKCICTLRRLMKQNPISTVPASGRDVFRVKHRPKRMQK